MKKRPKRPFRTTFLMNFREKRPKRPFRTIFLMIFHEKEAETAISYYFSHEFSWKEAETAISYDFSHENSWQRGRNGHFVLLFLWKFMKKTQKIEPIKTGFRFKPVWIKPVCGLNRF
jgi:hypothetical protein